MSINEGEEKLKVTYEKPTLLEREDTKEIRYDLTVFQRSIATTIHAIEERLDAFEENQEVLMDRLFNLEKIITTVVNDELMSKDNTKKFVARKLLSQKDMAFWNRVRPLPQVLKVSSIPSKVMSWK